MSTAPPNPARHFPVIRVFVSSTFSDLVAERNALAEQVWPELERYCRQRGFTFQAIDLRWGVPSEAGLDHRTMQICFEELHRAQEASPEPNFLILLGDKYGWRPLPETISETEYARLFEHTQSPEEQRTLEDWYRRDANARPPHHILRARTESPDGQDYTRVPDADGRLHDTDAWFAVQETLWAIVNRKGAYPASLLRERFAEGTKDMPASVRFQGSATEQEIWNGALKVENAREHVVAWFRKIDRTAGDPQPSQLKHFLDLRPDQSPDTDAAAALNELKAQVEQKLAPEPILHALCRWATDASGAFTGEVTSDHLAPMCETILTRLRALILRQINDYWKADLSADDATAAALQSSPHALDLELRDHQRFAKERGPVDGFIGRDAQVRTLRDYLQASTNRPLIVHGPSGSGKTALLAYVAQQPFLPGAEAGGVSPVILRRFIGTHPESSTLRGLITSLCRELRVYLPITEPLPDTLQKLIEEFYSQLGYATANQPIYVFLDALDQLEAADQAREVFWVRSQTLLKTGEAPCHARIVASCLSPSPEFSAESDVCEPFRRLQSRGLLADEELGALSEAAACQLLRQWLANQQRGLTEDQWKHVDAALRESSERRQPLYLRTLLEQLRGRREFDELMHHPASLSQLMQETLTRLGKPNQHGPLVRIALGYLVSARYGLSEGELLEVLLRDPEMKTQIETAKKNYGHQLPTDAHRYPIAPWARLRSDLRSYLSERAAPGSTVLSCYHRQVEQAVRTLFLTDEATRMERRRLLADYFDDRWDQPDAHALMELPDLLLALQDYRRLHDRLTDFAFPMRKSEVGLLETILDDYTRLRKELPADIHVPLVVWQDFFREHAHILRRGVETQTVHKILLQLALEHAEDSPVTTAAEKWLSAERCNWLRLQRLPRPPHVLRNPCVATFEGHTKGVKGAVMLKNGRLLSWSDDGTIRLWNVETASCEATLWDHDSAVKTPDDLQTERAFDLVIGGGVKEVVYIPSGLLVSWSKYQHFLTVWDAERGILLTTLQGHTGEINDALVMEDGRLVSWSEDNFGGDRNLCLWDIASGACGQVIDADQFFDNSPPSVDNPLWGIAERSWSINRFKGAIKLDATHLVVCSTNGTAKLWDAANAACVGTLAPQLDEEIKGVLDLADGRFLSWSDGNDVRVWERDSCLCLMTLEGHTKAVNGALKLSDGCLLTWSDDFTLRLWRGHDGASLAELKGHASDIRCVLQLSNGNLLSCSDDFTLRLWNRQSSACMAIFEGHTQGVLGAIELDDARVLSWSNDYTLRIWDMAWGECLAVLRGHTDEVRGVLKFEDGRLLSWSDDGTLRIWDLADKRLLAATEGHDGVIRGAKVLEDGRIVSWSVDETIRMWDCRSGECISTLDGQLIGVSDVGELRGGRIVSWSGSTLYVWNIETGMCLATHDGHEASVYGARAFGNRKVLSWSSDGMLRVWNIMSGNCLATMVGHNKAVSGTLDLPGRRLLTWSQESDLIIWDSQTGECLAKLAGHTGQVLGALALKTGRLISWGDDQTLRVWDAETGTCLMTYKRLIEARTRLNGDVVAWGYQDILLLDGDTGFCKLTLSGHTGWVGGVVELTSQQLASWSNNGIQRRLLDVESFDGTNSPSTQTPQASPEVAFRLWDGTSGACLEVLSKAEALERYPDWLHAQALSVKPAWTSHDYFVTFYSRTAELRHKAITGIVAAWHAESEVYASSLLSDGTAVFLQANFQISILHLHHGKQRVSLDEARQLVPSPAKNAALETRPRRYFEIDDCLISWEKYRVFSLLKINYKPERPKDEAVNPPRRQRSVTEIKQEAAAWEQKHLWEAAATHYDNLLKAGEPLAALGVPLVRCLVQTNSDLLPGTITRVQSIISDLEDQGLSELALEARRHLEAKLPSPRKPWWKVW